MSNTDESGVHRVVRCAQCRGHVEDERRCYAVPTCLTCLPPPPIATRCIDCDRAYSGLCNVHAHTAREP